MSDNDEVRPAPRSQPTALGLGERLRSARKAKALSVAQVSEVLRLEQPLVAAIEEERFEVLGAPVFVRGHLRRYAQLVGLPVDSVLDAYLAASPHSREPPALTRPRLEPAIEGAGSWVLWLAGIVLLVVVVFFLVDEEEPARPSTLPAPVQPAPDLSQPVPVPVPLPGTAPGTGAAPGDAPAAPLPEAGAVPAAGPAPLAGDMPPSPTAPAPGGEPATPAGAPAPTP